MPTSLLQTQRAKENKHTRRATVQVNNLTTACTPGGKGRQEKVTAVEKGEESRRREGGREIQSSLLMTRGTNDTGGERGRDEDVDGGRGRRIKTRQQ